MEVFEFSEWFLLCKSVKPRFNNDCDNLDLVQTVQIVAVYKLDRTTIWTVTPPIKYPLMAPVASKMKFYNFINTWLLVLRVNWELIATSAYIRCAHSGVSTWSLHSLRLRASHSHSLSLRSLGLHTLHSYQRLHFARHYTIFIKKNYRTCMQSPYPILSPTP